MFYSRNLFDTIIIIVCVTARASLHTTSNVSKTSFIDFILDSEYTELVRSSNMIHGSHTFDTKARIRDKSDLSNPNATHVQSKEFCNMSKNVLNSIQVKYCNTYYDILQGVLPKISSFAKEECEKLTSDLRWNCTSIKPYLNRSSHLGWYHMNI